MKIYFKKRNPVSSYTWFPFFVVLPRFIEDKIAGTSPLVWLTWAWRRGPFGHWMTETKTDKFGTKYRIEKKRYEYRIDKPKEEFATRIYESDPLVDKLIASKEDVVIGDARYYENLKRVERLYKIFERIQERKISRWKEEISGTPPPPHCEGSGAASI
jgi:hypothetical protein